MSQVWGVTMVRDEEDIIAYTLLHLIAEGIDGIVIADNGSVDATVGILEEIKSKAPIPIEIVEDKEYGYYQGRKMTTLAAAAKGKGADWIIPFDADELWYFSAGSRLGDLFRDDNLPEIIAVPQYFHVETAMDGCDKNPYIRMQWRQPEHHKHQKVCFKWAQMLQIMQGNHGITLNGKRIKGEDVGIRIRHLQYRGVDHFIRKSIQGNDAYEAAPELPAGAGYHWKADAKIIRENGIEAARAHYLQRHFIESPDKCMVHDPAPYKGVTL